MMRSIRTKLFGISLDEATFARRRFPACAPAARERLEEIGRTFLTGYLIALAADDAPDLATRLDVVPLERRGFAYEGASMALGLMDILLPWNRRRFSTFVEGPARPHEYMAYVGLGWALARLHRNVDRALRTRDPLIRWLALDGYGFHECYFRWERVMNEQRVPGSLRGYSLRAFDQGVGRCLWFVNGADPEGVADVIAGFAEHRRSDLWSGVGLASAYAGGASSGDLLRLVDLSGGFRPELSQGILFAVAARRQAGNMAEHTERACSLLCGLDVQEAQAIVDAERRGLPYNAPLPAYEVWRRRIQQQFTNDSPLALRSAQAHAAQAAHGRGAAHLTDERNT